MKNIQPITIWKDGQSVQSSFLKIQINFDDVSTHAVFQYELYDNQNQVLITGTINITGDDYVNWSIGGNSNEEAYQYVASSLNLVLVT
jgi:hypothetical protein